MIETFPDYRDDRDISNITIFFIPISIWYRGANDEFYIATNSTNCKLLNQVKDTSAKILERAINLVENKYQNVPISSSFFSKWCLPPPIEIQEAWKRQIPDGGSRKFKKDARKEQRLWAFWVAITRSVLKLLTPVILFCISPPLPGSRLPFRLSPPLPAYPSENHAAGNYLKMPSRRSPQKRNILRSFQSRTRQYRGRGEEKEEAYDAEKLARKKGISSSFFFFFEEKNGPTSALCTRPSTLKDSKKETGTPWRRMSLKGMFLVFSSRETHLVGISINSACSVVFIMRRWENCYVVTCCIVNFLRRS